MALLPNGDSSVFRMCLITMTFPVSIGLMTVEASACLAMNCVARRQEARPAHHVLQRDFSQHARGYFGWRPPTSTPSRIPYMQPRYIPGNGVRDDACDLPSSRCDNNHRITG
jgi:hypothetical protein